MPVEFSLFDRVTTTYVSWGFHAPPCPDARVPPLPGASDRSLWSGSISQWWRCGCRQRRREQGQTLSKYFQYAICDLKWTTLQNLRNTESVLKPNSVISARKLQGWLYFPSFLVETVVRGKPERFKNSEVSFITTTLSCQCLEIPRRFYPSSIPGRYFALETPERYNLTICIIGNHQQSEFTLRRNLHTPNLAEGSQSIKNNCPVIFKGELEFLFWFLQKPREEGRHLLCVLSLMTERRLDSNRIVQTKNVLTWNAYQFCTLMAKTADIPVILNSGHKTRTYQLPVGKTLNLGNHYKCSALRATFIS